MYLIIEPLMNGWKLTKQITNEDNMDDEDWVFSYQGDTQEEETDILIDLLNAIAEKLLPYDKWDKTNIKIIKGHKVEET